ncbi:unnamed protein product [Pieris macdunnoughi]|uniref:Uncharacterized protein n=1 Tax=Pieris macdunnoughi TaxID=345717 RepID=A0A821XAA2_9NEOP|nr:unnamed protein product [Pieris macdunnoughi]
MSNNEKMHTILINLRICLSSPDQQKPPPCEILLPRKHHKKILISLKRVSDARKRLRKRKRALKSTVWRSVPSFAAVPASRSAVSERWKLIRKRFTHKPYLTYEEISDSDSCVVLSIGRFHDGRDPSTGPRPTSGSPRAMFLRDAEGFSKTVCIETHSNSKVITAIIKKSGHGRRRRDVTRDINYIETNGQ